MQVVICDDDESCCSRLEQWLLEYGLREKVNLDISIYNSAERLLEHMDDNRYFDVIFLDIELPKKNGIEMGKLIRERFKDYITKIIFISAKTEYCLEMFELEPLNFHHKPLVQEKIEKDMDKIMERAKIGKKVYSYQEDGISKGILVGDIVYVEACQKRLKIVTTNGKSISVRDSLNDLEEDWKTYFFCRCHRSYLVNMSHVVECWSDRVLLSNGEELSVGGKYAKNLRNVLLQYEFIRG